MGNGGYEAAYGDIRNLQNSWNSEEAKIRSMAQRLEAMLSEISAAANKAIQADQSAPQAGHQSVQAQQKAQHISDLLKTAKEDVQNAIDAVHALSGQLNADAGKLAETAATYQRAEQAATGHVTGQAQLASYTSPGGGSGGGYAGGGSGGGGGAGGAGGAGGGVYSGGGTGTPVAPNAAASSPQVEQWVKEAIKELEKEGVPASKLDPNAIKLIIMHESGGNPNAINRTDINAQEGHPSQGLMQTIPSTFNQYASPGHGNIVNPVDNIMAGCKYAIARYGSLDSVPGVVAVEHGGSYVGY